jgi:hypothetical protein
MPHRDRTFENKEARSARRTDPLFFLRPHSENTPSDSTIHIEKSTVLRYDPIGPIEKLVAGFARHLKNKTGNVIAFII